MERKYIPELTESQDKYRNKIQSKIAYCEYCQPYDDGEIFWLLGNRTELEDLFYGLNVPENYWDKIILHLHCPSCGNTTFNRASDIGTKTKFEAEIDKHMNEVYGLYGS